MRIDPEQKSAPGTETKTSPAREIDEDEGEKTSEVDGDGCVVTLGGNKRHATMLKPVGSNGYLKQFLEDLKSQRPDLDARLVTAILLCLVAGERHLLIRTEENDVAKVAAVAADVR